MEKNKGKTMIMNSLKIVCAGLMLVVMMPAAYAGGAFSKLPLGLEIGKPLSDKLKRVLDTTSHPGKIKVSEYASIYINNGLVSGFRIYFNPAFPHGDPRVPKNWSKLGITFCNKDQRGTTLHEMAAIARKEGAKVIKADTTSLNSFRDDEHAYDKLIFIVDEKYSYITTFWMESQEMPHCKSGLDMISVSEYLDY